MLFSHWGSILPGLRHFFGHIPAVRVQQVRTPVVNSEAKVLVPGVPGHHAAIKPAPPQIEEVESKRKLGENEVMQSLLQFLSLKFKMTCETLADILDRAKLGTSGTH